MTYLIGQIALYLAVALMIGLGFGWLLGAWRAGRSWRGREAQWKEQLERREVEQRGELTGSSLTIDSLRSEVSELEGELAAVTEELQVKSAGLRSIKADMASLQAALVHTEHKRKESTRRVAELEAKLHRVRRYFSSKKSRIRAGGEQIDNLDSTRSSSKDREQQLRRLKDAHASALSDRDTEIRRLRHEDEGSQPTDDQMAEWEERLREMEATQRSIVWELEGEIERLNQRLIEYEDGTESGDTTRTGFGDDTVDLARGTVETPLAEAADHQEATDDDPSEQSDDTSISVLNEALDDAVEEAELADDDDAIRSSDTADIGDETMVLAQRALASEKDGRSSDSGIDPGDVTIQAWVGEVLAPITESVLPNSSSSSDRSSEVDDEPDPEESDDPEDSEDSESQLRDADEELTEEHVSFDKAETEKLGVLGDGAGIEIDRNSSVDDVDNLRKIYGVGRSVEASLRDLGYSTFRSIADWSDDDIDRVADEIEQTSERIREDDWVGQAQELYEQKQGESP